MLSKEITRFFDDLLEHDPPTLGPDALVGKSTIGSIGLQRGYWVLLDRRTLRPTYGHC